MGRILNPYCIIEKYYTKGSDLYTTLVAHSECVMNKALSIARKNHELNLDVEFIKEAAMLHDIGIFRTSAPGIYCHGTHEYIEHGYLGAEILREEGYPRHALVCERHTGTGLSKESIVEGGWNIPHRDMIPISMEEQIICFADLFFSKTALNTELEIEYIQKKLAQFGDANLKQLDIWRIVFDD